MVKAFGLISCRLFEVKQDWPGTINGRVLKLLRAALPFTPHGSALAVPAQGAPPAILTQVTLFSVPAIVRALPVAMLTPVFVSHPPTTPLTKPFWPTSPGKL